MRKRSMASFLFAGVALALFGATQLPPAWAGDGLPPPNPGTARPETPGAPGAEHRRLDALAGRWNVTESTWTDPGRSPSVEHGVATFTAILGGRHLRQELWIGSKDKPFEGVGYLGYDSATGKYDSLWMDVNFTGTILAHGDYDPASRSYTFVGAMADPAQRGGSVPLREVMHVQDANHFSYEYYERHGGREALAVRLDYARMN